MVATNAAPTLPSVHRGEFLWRIDAPITIAQFVATFLQTCQLCRVSRVRGQSVNLVGISLEVVQELESGLLLEIPRIDPALLMYSFPLGDRHVVKEMLTKEILPPGFWSRRTE